VFRDMEKWVEIRRKVLANEASKRAICREYKLHWDTLQRILKYPEPPEYQQKEPRKRPKIGEFLPIIHEILKSDQQVHRKQRHTAKRIFERLQGEHEYEGGYTGVKDAVRAWREQHKEVFLPLSHPPGEAQVDFGEADVTLRGETTRVALFVMTLPYSDAIFCQVFPRECTEAFLEGHRRAFEFFGGVPRRISYDNSKIAVAKITGSREREVTHEFLRLESHYLFEHHFCLVRRPNEKGHVERLLDFAKPLEHWDLPECFGLLRRRLEAERAGEGTREFIKVLRLLEHASPGELGKAIDYALDIGTTEADAVRLILEHRREQPVKLFRLDGRPHLADVVVERPHLMGYRSLLVEV